MTISKAIEYFQKFRESKLPEYFEDMKEFKVWPEGGYPNFYKDTEVVQCLINIYCNLEETYSDLSIPEGFTSEKALVQSWKRFYEFLKDYDKLFDEIKKHLDNKFREEDEVIYPIVFTQINEDRHQVIDVLEEILEYEEVVKVLSKLNSKSNNETKLNLHRDKSPDYDAIIVTVLYTPEFVHIKQLLTNTQLLNINDPSKTIYYSGELIGITKKIKVLLACSNQMGMPVAASLTTKLIYLYNPKIIAMCGICAGTKGDIGDILAPDILWDYGSGKNYIDIIKTKSGKKKKIEKFDPYRYPEYVNNEIIKKIIELSHNKKYLNDIRNRYPIENHFENFPDKLSLRVGPYASGSAVIANERILKHIKSQDGKLIGFDMEAYGVIYSVNNCNKEQKPTCLIFKSISDYGDSNKNHPDKNKHQDFGAFTSANYLTEFILNEI